MRCGVQHQYTTGPLGPDASTRVERVPGARDIARLFQEPASSGRGALTVEGGITVVGAPGMGVTTLLARLSDLLERERAMPVARIELPVQGGDGGPDAFYRFLGALVDQARAGLLLSPRLRAPDGGALAAALADEPPWEGDEPAITPRGLERWIAQLAPGARRTGGVCLLVDGIDHAAATSWKAALVAALRFTFQSSVGVTPVYGAWSLFLDESLPGSNYFRNVTRPLFLSPLSPRERHALVDAGLPALSPAARARLDALVGGHPRLWHSALSAIAGALGSPEEAAALAEADVDALLERTLADDRAFVAAMLRAAPALAPRLRALRSTPGKASRALLASGLVDERDGVAVVPARIAALL